MSQPKIIIEPEPIDWIIEIIGAIGLIFLIGIPLYYYNSLPEIIPQHFNAQGEVDGYGGRTSIWILPVIGIITYIGLFWLNKYPHIFNYPKKITHENAERQYKLATRLIRVINVTIVWLFCYLCYSMIQSALNMHNSLGTYFIIIFLSFIFIPIGFYLYKSAKAK